MQIAALYTSHWEEGDITTPCVINFPACSLGDIQPSDEGDDYEHHHYDDVQVEVNGNYLHFKIDEDTDDINDADKQKLKEAIQQELTMSL